MTKYIIISTDRTAISNPRRMWIFHTKSDCKIIMDELCDNKDWITPQMFEVDDIILNGDFLR